MRGGRGAYTDWPDSDTVFRDTLSKIVQE